MAPPPDPGAAPPPAIPPSASIPVIGVSALVLAAIVACIPPLTPKDEADIAILGTKLAECQAEGRAAYADGGRDAGLAAYEGCKDAGGIK